MKTALIALGLVLGLLVAPIALQKTNKSIMEPTTTVSVDSKAAPEAIPQAPDTLEQSADLKIQAVKKIITLEDRNTVELRGPVTDSSVGATIQKLRVISRQISKDTPIYLVLDTPGGDIQAGTDLIDFAKALPQKVHTVTLFAASMGFQIAQNLDTRFIITNGQLMSHRAKVGGLGGQIKGEFETRYRMIRRTVDALDYIASKRMGIDVKTYENLIFNEYWVYGFDAVGAKAADEEVLVRCGESLSGSNTVDFETMFGPVKVQFSKCPLIKQPEAIEMSRVSEENRENVLKIVKMSLLGQKQFVDTYITTDKFHEIFY